MHSVDCCGCVNQQKLFKRPITPLTTSSTVPAHLMPDTVTGVPRATSHDVTLTVEKNRTPASKLLLKLRTPRIPTATSGPATPRAPAWYQTMFKRKSPAPHDVTRTSPLAHPAATPALYTGPPLSLDRSLSTEPHTAAPSSSIARSDTVPYDAGHDGAAATAAVVDDGADAVSVATEPDPHTRKASFAIDVGSDTEGGGVRDDPQDAMLQGRRGSEGDVTIPSTRSLNRLNSSSRTSQFSPTLQPSATVPFFPQTPKQTIPSPPIMHGDAVAAPHAPPSTGSQPERSLSLMATAPSVVPNGRDALAAQGSGDNDYSSSDSGSSSSSSTSTTTDSSLMDDSVDSSSDESSAESDRSRSVGGGGVDVKVLEKRRSAAPRRKRNKYGQFDWLNMADSDYGSEFDTESSSSSSGSSSNDGGVVETKDGAADGSDGGGDTDVVIDTSLGHHRSVSGKQLSSFSHHKRQSSGSSSRHERSPRAHASSFEEHDAPSHDEQVLVDDAMQAVDANEHEHEHGDAHEIVMEGSFRMSLPDAAHSDGEAKHSIGNEASYCCDDATCQSDDDTMCDMITARRGSSFTTEVSDEPSPFKGSHALIHRSITDSEYTRAALQAELEQESEFASSGRAHKQHHHHHRHRHRRRATTSDSSDRHNVVVDGHAASESSGIINPMHAADSHGSGSERALRSGMMTSRFEDPQPDIILDSSVYVPVTDETASVIGMDSRASPVMKSGSVSVASPSARILSDLHHVDDSASAATDSVVVDVHPAPVKTMSSSDLVPVRSPLLASRTVPLQGLEQLSRIELSSAVVGAGVSLHSDDVIKPTTSLKRSASESAMLNSKGGAGDSKRVDDAIAVKSDSRVRSTRRNDSVKHVKRSLEGEHVTAWRDFTAVACCGCP